MTDYRLWIADTLGGSPPPSATAEAPLALAATQWLSPGQVVHASNGLGSNGDGSMNNVIQSRLLPLPLCVVITLCVAPSSVADAERVGRSGDRALAAIFVGHIEHDFGSIRAGPRLQHQFRVTNSGSAELRITNVRTNCGCMVAGEVWNRDATSYSCPPLTYERRPCQELNEDDNESRYVPVSSSTHEGSTCRQRFLTLFPIPFPIHLFRSWLQSYTSV
jgi:hypothetical protein